jgi:hypothetical protein
MIAGHELDVSVLEYGQVTGAGTRTCALRKIGKFLNRLRNY